MCVCVCVCVINYILKGESFIKLTKNVIIPSQLVWVSYDTLFPL